MNGNVRNKNCGTEMKNASNGFINRANIAEKRISELEDRSVEITQTENKGKKIVGKKRTGHWNTVEYIYTHHIQTAETQRNIENLEGSQRKIDTLLTKDQR